MYVGVLSFDLRQSDTSAPTDYPDIIIASDALTLTYDVEQDPRTAWTSYSVSMHENAGWKNFATGKRATRSEMVAVLSALADLQIRGEYQAGADTGGLDNVVLTPPVLHQVFMPLVFD